jgi:cation diffusion facilitator CzcD-associated flavoprotein CzcO
MATAATGIAPPVIIVGAGPSGLAASACLARRGVASLVLERDDCVGSLWRKRAYDRLHLHLPKQISALPHAPHADDAPDYLPRDHFVRYLDAYADRFDVRTRLRREVRAARFVDGRWEVEAVDLGTGDAERHAAKFLVVATGEFDERVLPEVPGLDTFTGEAMHSRDYASAEGMRGKAVLVVGCGNSGMEIALDLAEGGAATSIVVRGELHLMTREIDQRYTPCLMVKTNPAQPVVADVDVEAGVRRAEPAPMQIQTSPSLHPVMDFSIDTWTRD